MHSCINISGNYISIEVQFEDLTGKCRHITGVCDLRHLKPFFLLMFRVIPNDGV